MYDTSQFDIYHHPSSDPNAPIGLQGGGVQPTGFSNFNTSPRPGGYNSTFGGVPGNVGLPNPFQDLSSVYPGLGPQNQQASTDIMSQLQGNLSPATLNALKNQAASWGVQTGMPNSPLSLNKGLSNVAGWTENQINQGLQNYGRIIPTVSGTQTVSPQQKTDIAAHNAALNAAPNPAQAQSYAQQLFDRYLQQLRGPGGGTGTPFNPQQAFSGGTPSPSPFSGSTGTTGPIQYGDYDYNYLFGPQDPTSVMSPPQDNLFDSPTPPIEDFGSEFI